MDHVEKVLNSFSGGKLLDVATGRGFFAQYLIDNLKDYEKVYAIDNCDITKLQEYQKHYERCKFEFIQMDACHLDFPDSFFDTVSISNSLHHLIDTDAALREMLRVLKPGGLFIVNEMKKDEQTEAQMTHVKLHHWWGKIDTLKGIVHKETLTKREILDYVERLPLIGLKVFESYDKEKDPMDHDSIDFMDKVVDEYIERAHGLKEFEALKQEGEQLRKWLHENGTLGATQLLIIGCKPLK